MAVILIYNFYLILSFIFILVVGSKLISGNMIQMSTSHNHIIIHSHLVDSGRSLVNEWFWNYITKKTRERDNENMILGLFLQ